ncbi:medium-chain fatty acid-CoA ligase faa2 [Coemansia sp. RSA 1365]|nr:medium-chain fatty acid-CoA ligase faa2 [Coemansia sp. RSA 1365]
MLHRTGSAPQCSIELQDAQPASEETMPYLNHNIDNGRLISHTPGLNSLYDTFLRGRALAGRSSAAFGYRPIIDELGNAGPYEWITWDNFHERFVNLASGFRHIGLQPGDRVGVMLGNSIEWMLTEYASYYQCFVLVPLYETLGPDSLEQIVQETGMRTVVCDTKHIGILHEISETSPLLQSLIVTGTSQSELIQISNNSSTIHVQSFDSTEELGARQPIETKKLPVADDVATIVYTSGTSGRQKGVVIRHANFLASIAAVLALRDAGDMYNFSTKDCSMGFLPLAHCLGRLVTHLVIASGGRTAFPRGDPAKLVEDLKDLQPTIFVGVPRIFNRIQDKVLSAVKMKGGLSSALFQYAYNTKRGNLGRGQLSHWLWDRVVFKPLREKFGGKLNLIVSGSAPISPETLEFLRCCFSCSVVEGYGLTETIGPTTITLIDDIEPGNVGAPIPCAMMKLRSVAELGYTVDDKPYPRGEVLIKGRHIGGEYYRQPEATREAFTKDGWLRTGDIGLIDSRGRLHIIDRKDNLFKLAQGEFIAPEHIENVLMDHFIVDQAFVYGNPLQNYLVAIIVPDEKLLSMFLQNKGIISQQAAEHINLEDFCDNDRVLQSVISELAIWGKAHSLRGFEIPKRIRLVTTSLGDAGLLTPTLKLKRRAAQAYFKDTLADLYSDNPN